MARYNGLEVEVGSLHPSNQLILLRFFRRLAIAFPTTQPSLETELFRGFV